MSTITMLVETVDPVEFRSVENITKYRFILMPESQLIASGDDSEEVLLTVPERGKLVGITVATVSEDYNISLRTDVEVELPSVKEVYQVSNINQTWAEYGLEILYSNDEFTPSEALYLILTNNDAGNDVDDIEITLFISVM